METNTHSLTKYAMHYGAIFGAYWIAKYPLMMLSFTYNSAIILYWGLTLLVPVLAFLLTKNYRDKYRHGEISFFHAWRFGIMLYLCAAIMISLLHFVFYKYVAPEDFIANSLNTATKIMTEATDNPEFLKAVENHHFYSPITMAVQGIFSNVFYGILLSIPVAFFVKREPKEAHNYNEN